MATPEELFLEIKTEVQNIKTQLSQSGNLKTTIKSSITFSLDKIEKLVQQQQQLFLHQNEKTTPNTITPKQTFVQAVSQQKPQKQSTKHVLTITPKDNTITSSETRKQLKSKINPINIKVGINRVQNISKGGLLIECETKEEIDRLSQELKTNLAVNMDIKIPEKKKPKVIIYNLSNDDQKEEIEEAIHNYLATTTGMTTQDEVRFKFFTKAKSANLRNAVIEVSPNARKTLLSSGKVNIGWSRCIVADFISVTRCFKCLGFGHIAKYCSQTQQKCSNCAGDHKHSDCDSSDNHKTCLNCVLLNSRTRNSKLYVDTKHSAMDNNCHCFKYQKSQTISKIDYGS